VTPLRRYYRGRNLVTMRDVAAGQSRVYHFDHQGTTQCLTDQTGAVTDRFASDAWGVQVKRTGTSINRQWYIGHSGYYRELDVALDYVRERFLDPRMARWLTLDLLSSAEPYGYVANQPSAAIDSTGAWKYRVSKDITVEQNYLCCQIRKGYRATRVFPELCTSCVNRPQSDLGW
jgi:RHS repeat-associated protein